MKRLYITLNSEEHYVTTWKEDCDVTGHELIDFKIQNAIDDDEIKTVNEEIK